MVGEEWQRAVPQNPEAVRNPGARAREVVRKQREEEEGAQPEEDLELIPKRRPQQLQRQRHIPLERKHPEKNAERLLDGKRRRKAGARAP